MRTLSLALGGGGAKGIAHIGVLKILCQADDLKIETICGTSMGGLIAALYATGKTPDEIEEIALSELEQNQTPRGMGIRGRTTLATWAESFIEQHLGSCTFDRLKIPLCVTAVDLNMRRAIVLDKGSVAEAVRATIAVPGILEPVRRQGQLLVDGGILDNVPVDVARNMSDSPVVAVNLHPRIAASPLGSIKRSPIAPQALVQDVDTLWRAFTTMRDELTDRNLAMFPPDLTIMPHTPEGVGILSGYDRVDELVRVGELAAIDALPRLEEVFSSKA